VITLIAQRGGPGAPPEIGRAFSTPTVVHFTTVLFLAALARAPWQSMTAPAIIGGLVGAAGIVYMISIHRLIRKQDSYEPVFEDWFFHCLLPLAAYLSLLVLSLISSINARVSFFGTAAVALALLLTGIHNAWDTVTWHVFSGTSESKRDDLTEDAADE